LGYLPIAVPESLKEWKVAIISVKWRYEFMKECHNYQTETGTTYGGQGIPIDIGKSNKNFKDRKSKCFNCETYRHIARDCKKLKKKKDTRKCYKCERMGHIARDCRTKQKMKKMKYSRR